MPITPSDILPRRQVPEIATGPVVAVGVGSVSVRIRPDLTVLVSTSTPYAVGQMVSVAIPGGNLSSAQIIGGAAGSAPRIRQVVV
jgi:hypothetical protein